MCSTTPSTSTPAKRPVGVGRRRERSNRLPDRPPPGPELPTEAVDRGVLTARLLDRPPTGPRRELPSRGGRRSSFDERRDWTRRLPADPTSLAPADLDRSSHRRRVDQAHLEHAVAARDDAAGLAAHHARRGLNSQRQHAAVVALDINDAWPVEANPQLAHGASRPTLNGEEPFNRAVRLLVTCAAPDPLAPPH